MTLAIPILETERLLIRPFIMDDLENYHQINVAVGWVDEEKTAEANLQARREWLEWAVRNHEQLARLYQTPYGDRAVVLKATKALIGSCGLVPLTLPMAQLSGFGGKADSLASAEMGLFWIIDPAHQRQGYAAEAAAALIDYAFQTLRLDRIVATTEFTNEASMGVMRRLGMQIERNPYPEPPWLQVVGVLANGRK
jgi:RimJ/RimL family protein N-acetyltransferase